MSSVFKKTRDRKRAGASWYIAYVDEEGMRRMVKGCPDKAATEAMARKLESEAELRRRGVIDPRADAYAAHERKPLDEHVGDFFASLVAKGGTGDHARKTANRVRRVLTLCHARRLSDLPPSRVLSALKAVRDTGASAETVNHHVRAVKAFSRWLWRDGRVREHGLAHLTTTNPEADRRHSRRALLPDEAAALVAAAERGGVVWGVSGPDRATLYRVALGTGFRRGELASLTRESFDLSADPPTVTVRAAYSKRRRDDAQPIRPDLADSLRAWLATKAPGRPVFGTLTRHTARMMRRDLEAAGVPYRDGSNRVADFHSLRHSYVSALARSNAPVKVIQTLARHSTPSLTFGVYAHIGVFDQTAALEALPDLSPEAVAGPEAMAATGTDPAPGNRIDDCQWVAHGQREGDGSGRNLAVVGGIERTNDCGDALPSGDAKTLENKAPDASLRQLAVSGGEVPGVGFEPTHPCGRGILSPLRLPFRHPGSSL
jgi:integrase